MWFLYILIFVIVIIMVLFLIVGASSFFSNDDESDSFNINEPLYDKNKVEYVEDIKLNKYNDKTICGIYAILIDKQENKYIKESIPLYIGQARDIYTRWIQHIKNLETAEKYIVKSTTYTQIIHYLNTHNLTIKDLKFCILEANVSPSLLDQEEMYLIRHYNSSMFGWNQTRGNINTDKGGE